MKKIVGIITVTLSLGMLYLSNFNSSKIVSDNIEALTDSDYYLDPSKYYESGIADAYSSCIAPLTPKSGNYGTCHQMWKCTKGGEPKEYCKGAGITWYIEEWTELL